MIVKFVVSDASAANSQPTMAIVQPVEQYSGDYDFAVSFRDKYRLLVIKKVLN